MKVRRGELIWEIFGALTVIALLLPGVQGMSYISAERAFRQMLESNTSYPLLPPINQPLSMEQEIDQYNIQYSNITELQYFTGDPELNVNFILENQEGKNNQSIFVFGQELSTLLLEVTIEHQGDHFNHQKQHVSLIIFNKQTHEFFLAQNVRHFRAFKVQLYSGLYQIGISCAFQKQISSEALNRLDIQIEKHISLRMEVISSTELNKEEPIEVVYRELGMLKDETDRIFMSSLQIWDEVGRHESQHESNSLDMYIRSYFQMVSLLGIYSVQYLLLKRVLDKKSIV